MIAAITIPALIALLFKLLLLGYATKSTAKNTTTRLFLGLLLVLALHNLVEFFGLNYFVAHGLTETMVAFGFAYVAFLIPAIALILHISLRISLDYSHGSLIARYEFLLHLPAALLLFLLLFTDRLIVGFQPFQNSVLRVPGPLYFLFETYVALYLIAAFVNLLYGARAGRRPIINRTRNRLWLLALLPTGLLLVYLIVANHFGWAKITSTIYIPATLTFFLAVTTYATHQYRLFDIGFYIPWSKIRRRKSAFYQRIQAMIAEVADLGTGSAKQALDRLADTLRCPVAFVDDNRSLTVAVGAPQMLAIPLDTLKCIDHILVANEIADTNPRVCAVMKQHGVAAIVPFHPHSHNAASWLLLGEAFSEQVYTARDFRMVERLFDKMADLFLDKLVEMRTRLADAHLQLQTLRFQVERAQSTVSGLEQKVEVLSRENLRLAREQPADSLLATDDSIHKVSITMLGRDKIMLRQLRERFPQLQQYASPDSTSFRRHQPSDVLLCEVVETDASTAHCKLLDLFGRAQESALLLYGSGAAQFAYKHRADLLDSIVEVLPPGSTIEAMTRKIEALVRLRKSLTAVNPPELPLLGCSVAYRDAIAEATRLAGFRDPVCIEALDIKEAIAVARYMHARAGAAGEFRVIRAGALTKHESDDDGDIPAPTIERALDESAGGTLMIDNLGALSNEIWDRLLQRSDEFKIQRLIAACSPTTNRGSAALFEPLQPLVLSMPSLRERRADLPLLVHYFTLQYNLQAAASVYLSRTDIDDMMVCNYPTDIASLRSTVFECLRAKSGGKDRTEVAAEAPAIPDVPVGDREQSLEDHVAQFESKLIERTLARCSGNKSKAARLLNIRPNTLHYKLQRYGLLKK